MPAALQTCLPFTKCASIFPGETGNWNGECRERRDLRLALHGTEIILRELEKCLFVDLRN